MRLVEAEADAFTIMKMAGHSGVTISQRYLTHERKPVEPAFERLGRFNEQALKTANEGVDTFSDPGHC
jgi:hypothetical protein